MRTFAVRLFNKMQNLAAFNFSLRIYRDDDSIYDLQHGYYLEELSVGMEAVFAKTITDADVSMFAAVSGDINPLHLNDEFAKKIRFKGRIVHGMITTSLWPTLVGKKLPGPGCAYMGQEINFLKPVHVDETVTAKMTITKIDDEKQRVYLNAEAFVGETLGPQARQKYGCRSERQVPESRIVIFRVYWILRGTLDLFFLGHLKFERMNTAKSLLFPEPSSIKEEGDILTVADIKPENNDDG